ncbi:DUF4097 family beta strand repeat-containing protein [Telluribacter sp.]|jgi:DUF4097 and DUF4098 domain-containing protein YvlB|uniref:DUF4097 family beta strand repeat-containing protein n=1 Tax=Telluribacter sp. TaxID=1978767 RepID=UPI002E163828|nr:DUF4097 family beta strand repeat-containing protein [Telluribacter sp.]
MKNKAVLVLLLALVATFAAYAQSNKETPYSTKTFSGSLSNLRVETSGGSIAVEGTNSNGVKVDMYVQANNWNGRDNLSQAELEDRLKEYEIDIRTEGSTVIATAKRRNRDNNDWKRGLSIGFKVYTPRTMQTNLRTSGGSIRIASLTGEQNFTTSGGSIKVHDLDGVVRGRTSGGSIEVDKCTKDVELTTSGGSIRANDLNGKIALKTSGGSITLNNLDGDIEAMTSGGSIKGDAIKGALNTSTSGGSIRLAKVAGSLRASTSAGAIEVDFDRLGDYVTLSTSAGSVRVHMPMDKGLDLDLRGNKVNINSPLKNFNGRADKDRVQGSMNGGGIPVKLTANSGSVYVN